MDIQLQYTDSDTGIIVRPHIKYELPISMHVLDKAEDHHQLFIPWAEEMRNMLGRQLLEKVISLIRSTHEWQLGSLVQSYSGPDDIQLLSRYIELDNTKSIQQWAKSNKEVLTAVGVKSDVFPEWYSELILDYYNRGFYKSWEQEIHAQILEEAQSTFRLLTAKQHSPKRVLEKYTGVKPVFSNHIVLYPSSFSRPNHAYGFNEDGVFASVYKIGEGISETCYDIYHEMLHPLIRGWESIQSISNQLDKFERSILLRNEWESFGASDYTFPIGWIDELIVFSISTYIYSMESCPGKQFRYFQGKSFCSFTDALFEAIASSYSGFSSVFDFIEYAILHIQEVSSETTSSIFVYKP